MGKNIKVKFISTLILFIVLISTVTACSNVSNTEVKLQKEYLKNNYASIDINNSVDSLALLKEDALNNEVILAGEWHAIAKNFDIKLELLKYLHKNTEVKYLLCESGYASTELLNQYIHTGDIKLLDYVYENLQGTAAYSKEGYDFWKNLYEYNKTLADDEKIIAVGIDIEHQINSAMGYINTLIKQLNKELPKDIKNSILSIKTIYNNIEYSEKIAVLDSMLKHIAGNKALYTDFFGDMLFNYELTINNIRNSLVSYEKDFNTTREESIYNNFTKIYEHYPKGKFFGQWGSEHVYQNDCKTYLQGVDRFAMKLKDTESPVKGKVMSVLYAYNNSETTEWKNDYKQKSIGNGINNYNILSEFVTTDYTLFKLNGQNTPYSNKTTFIIKPLGGNTLNYFQYMLVVSNSKGTTRFK